MKRYKRLHIVNRYLIVFFAVFVALFVSFNQNIHQEIQKISIENKIPAQEDGTQAPDAEFSFISEAAIVPFFNLGAASASYFIFEISIVQDTFIEQLVTVANYVNVFFKTLFSRIISPNAP